MEKREKRYTVNLNYWQAFDCILFQLYIVQHQIEKGFRISLRISIDIVSIKYVPLKKNLISMMIFKVAFTTMITVDLSDEIDAH